MSFNTKFLLLLLSATWALIGIYVYLRKDSFALKGFIGFPYQHGTVQSDRLLSRLQLVAQAMQESTCAYVKPVWTNMRQSLRQSGTTLAQQNTSCAEQKTQILEVVRFLLTDSNVTDKLDDREAVKVHTAIAALMTDALDMTCVNDKMNVDKAISLMDGVVKSFCP